jgi:hypothetical protein
LTLTEAHVKSFAELTGDYNPLHFRRSLRESHALWWTRRARWADDRLLHALVAMDLPGPGSVFLSQQWKFTAPVYIGDTITAKAEVMSVHATKPVTQLRIDVTRQTGRRCSRAKRGATRCRRRRTTPDAEQAGWSRNQFRPVQPVTLSPRRSAISVQFIRVKAFHPEFVVARPASRTAQVNSI